MPKYLSKEFKSDLNKLAQTGSYELGLLEPQWPRIAKRIHNKRRALARKIPKDDPIRLSVDLLTPLDRIVDETLHTRALAYLLDPNARHGLGKGVLNAILAKIEEIRWGTGAPQVRKLVNRARTKIFVTPEYRYSIDGFRNRSLARCDIWITIQNRAGRALVVIENKIGAPEGKGQLGWYQQKARNWCKSNHARSPILIFLGPERIAKHGWVSLSYVDLASALRQAWRKSKSTPGRAWLGFYIASITNGVLEADVQNRPQDIDLDDLQSYLGRRE